MAHFVFFGGQVIRVVRIGFHLQGNIVHGGNEVLRWQIGCAVVYTDVNENKRVTKERSETKKVDGIIASIIAMNEYSHFRTSGSGEEFWGVISL